MRPIPQKLRKIIDSSAYYETCARKGSDCRGRITIEHSFLYAGTQINELWALLPLCWHHHLGTGLDKRLNEYLALQRATPEDLAKYPRTDWAQKLIYLKSLFEN